MAFRRSFGLRLWAARYNGALESAYQQGFGHICDDFDDPALRDRNFTYLTADGVAGTIQWEGFREAVDDLCYAATLDGVIAQIGPDRAKLAAEARVQMAYWITKLWGPTPYTPPGSG